MKEWENLTTKYPNLKIMICDYIRVPSEVFVKALEILPELSGRLPKKGKPAEDNSYSKMNGGKEKKSSLPEREHVLLTPGTVPKLLP
ncbi:hypothetical protein [Paenibacillus apii]|nr:hypothetical protein [Paenibacillus apii]NJJ42090.1 hypothetical protein [Paenibacillus apii]